MPHIKMVLPAYMQEIIDVLKQKNWIIHYFKITDEEIYSIPDYVHNHEINNNKRSKSNSSQRYDFRSIKR
jgi:hypothetical protein